MDDFTRLSESTFRMSQASAPGTDVELCGEQKAAVDAILSSPRPVTILTGEAGSGKSTVVNHLRGRVPMMVCATTGRAAMHVDGCTVDSAFAIARENWSIWSHSFQEYVLKQCPDLIVIDEASMIGCRMGNLIEEARKAFRKRILLVGDWAQARPVKDGWPTQSDLLRDYDFVKLTENHRQNEIRYLGALNKIRVGEVDEEVNEVFSSRTCSTPPDNDTWVRMFATNRKTEAYNHSRLFRHVHENQIGYCRLFASFEDMRLAEKQKSSPRSEAFKQNAIEQSRMAHGEPVAIGCRVMLTINYSQLDGGLVFVNGDTGEIVSGMCEDGRDLEKAIAESRESDRPFRVHSLEVRLDRTGQLVTVPRVAKNAKDALDRVTHRVLGWPIKLGYALTIHKSQGMTVQRAWVDMASLLAFPDDESRHGLAYVALSRTTHLEGLLIKDWCPQAVFCDSEIEHLL